MNTNAAAEPDQSKKVSYAPNGKASVRQRLYEKLHKPTQINSRAFALSGESAVVVAEFKPNSYDFVFRWRNQNVQVLIQANELRDDSSLYVYVGSLSKIELPRGFDLVRDGVEVDESDPGKLLVGLAGLAHAVAVEYKTKRAEAAAEPAQDPREVFCQRLKAKYDLDLDPSKITYMGRDGIDYDGTVNWKSKNLTRIPVRFRKVTGYFSCSSNHLTTLAGAPGRVGGDFYCYNNHLTTLAGAPGHVGGDFNCYHNHLPPGTKKPVGVRGRLYFGTQTPAPVHGAAEPALVHQSPNVLFLYLTDEIQNRTDPLRVEVNGYHVTISGRNDDGMRTYPVLTLTSEKWDKGFTHFQAYINQSKSVRGTYPALFDRVNGRKIVGDIHHGVNTPRALLKNAVKLAIKAAEAAHRSWLKYEAKAKKLNRAQAAAEPPAPYNNVPGIYYVSDTLESEGTGDLRTGAERVQKILNKHKFFPKHIEFEISEEQDIDGTRYRRVNFNEIKYTGSNLSRDSKRLVHELEENDSRLGIKFIDTEDFVDDYNSADADDSIALGAVEPAQDYREALCDKLKSKYNLELDPERITYMGRGGIDYDGSVNWSSKKLSRIPVRFRKVTGYFSCYNNRLTTLAGAPGHVGGDFSCYENHLTGLEHAPGHVGGDFYCDSNHLTTLAGAPGHVGRDFYCFNNHLTTLAGAPGHVGGYFNCSNNRLTTLEHAPGHVGGYFNCSNNRLPPDTKKPKGVKGRFVLGEQTPAHVQAASEIPSVYARLAVVVYSDHDSPSDLHRALGLSFVKSVAETLLPRYSLYRQPSEYMFNVVLELSELNDFAKFLRVLAETPKVVAVCDNPTAKPVLVTDIGLYRAFSRKMISALHDRGTHAS